MLSGCSTKELQKEVVYVDKKCPKPTVDITKFSEPKKVKIKVHKGSFVVTIKNEDYIKMKSTNQNIKDRYITLREWLITNIDNDLIKNEISKKEPD
jgi:hypothetical protein